MGLFRPGLAVVVALSLAGCSTEMAPAVFEGAQPTLRPESFFAGSTTSTGVLENRRGAPVHRFAVHGTGVVLPDGSLNLVQVIDMEQTPQETRSWVIRKVDDHHYEGTLTDASGPVRIEAYGNLVHIDYPMKSPPLGRMEQWLYLQPDGHTVLNEATVSLLGVVVAHLSERITQEASR